MELVSDVISADEAFKLVECSMKSLWERIRRGAYHGDEFICLSADELDEYKIGRLVSLGYEIKEHEHENKKYYNVIWA